MILKKLKEVVDKVKAEIQEIPDIIPEDKEKVIRQLLFDAAIAYGRARINKAIKNE
jgi:hypothetical protein